MGEEWYLQSYTGRHHSLSTAKSLTLGRRNCDVIIPSRSAEKNHAIIQFDHLDQRFQLLDLDTNHGTFINGQRVPSSVPVGLKPDDRLNFGQDPASYLLVRMNSEDSLNQDRTPSTSAQFDPAQQGPEIHDSPRSESRESPHTIAESHPASSPHLYRSPRHGPAQSEQSGPSDPSSGFDQHFHPRSSSATNSPLPPRKPPPEPHNWQDNHRPPGQGNQPISLNPHDPSSNLPSQGRDHSDSDPTAPFSPSPYFYGPNPPMSTGGVLLPPPVSMQQLANSDSSTSSPGHIATGSTQSFCSPSITPPISWHPSLGPPVPPNYSHGPSPPQGIGYPPGSHQIIYQPMLVPTGGFYYSAPHGNGPPTYMFSQPHGHSHGFGCPNHPHPLPPQQHGGTCPYCVQQGQPSNFQQQMNSGSGSDLSQSGQPSIPPPHIQQIPPFRPSPPQRDNYRPPPPPPEETRPPEPIPPIPGQFQERRLQESRSIGPPEPRNMYYRDEIPEKLESEPRPMDPQSSPDLKGARYHTGAKLEMEHGRTPIFGSTPKWWGGESSGPRPEMDDSPAQAGPMPTRQQSEIAYRGNTEDIGAARANCVSDTEALKRPDPPAPPPMSRPTSYREPLKMVISFDDDFKKATPPPKRKPKPAESTAFTIEFGNDESAKSSAEPDSAASKEAAWKAASAERAQKNFLRRSQQRRSLGVGMERPPPPPPTTAPPKGGIRGRRSLGAAALPKEEKGVKNAKEYLLNKMLSSSETADADHLDGKEPGKDNSDLVSEAGTYVIEGDRNKSGSFSEERIQTQIDEQEELEARRNIDKVFGLEEDKTPEGSSGTRTPSPAKPDEDLTPRDSNKSPNGSSRKGLLKELLKITQEPGKKSQKPTQQKSVSASEKVRPPTGQHFSRQCMGRKSINPASGNSAANTNGSSSSSNFQRRDGGRYSMRTGPERSQSTAPSPSLKNKKQAPPGKTPEMVAWLRRKQYNPMKAAKGGSKTPSAESSKGEASPDSDPPYLSNRSVSFHMGSDLTNGPKGSKNLKVGGRLEPVNSEEILSSVDRDSRFDYEMDRLTGADDEATGASESMLADFSRNIAESLDRMTEGSSRTFTRPAKKDLSQVVDKEELGKLVTLSRKLESQASAALITIQSQDLSNSVEDLVSRASAVGDEERELRLEGEEKLNVTALVDKMEQASLAFQAVNRYLSETCLAKSGLQTSESLTDCEQRRTQRRDQNSQPPEETIQSDSDFRVRRPKPTTLKHAPFKV